MEDAPSNVVQFPTKAEDDTHLSCGCGAVWFQPIEGETAAGTVCLSPDGRIVAYSALFRCVSCGEVTDVMGRFLIG